MTAFVDSYNGYHWYLDPVEGSGVKAGTVPMQPSSAVVQLLTKNPSTDMSLTEVVVGHEVVQQATRSGFCSIISASGAGKTKAVFDFLRVRCHVAARRDHDHHPPPYTLTSSAWTRNPYVQLQDTPPRSALRMLPSRSV